MILEGVKEKYDSLMQIGLISNPSSFILCECTKDKKKNYILSNIIPLENDLPEVRIDRDNLVLTDLDGNILIKFNEWDTDHTSFELINGNDLVISKYILWRNNPEEKYRDRRFYQLVEHYRYHNKELDNINTLFTATKGKLYDLKILNDDDLIIEAKYKTGKESSIYSLKKGSFITPGFTYLEEVGSKANKLFRFTDEIKSSLEINDIRFYSNVIGFVTADGQFYNGVYDELSNKEIECDLNSKPNFETYYELKKMIQGKLNEKVVKESNKQITRDFVIKKLENKAKNIISK